MRSILLLAVAVLAGAARITQVKTFGEGASAIGADQMTRPVRVHGGLLYGPSVGLYMESTGLMVLDPVSATIEEFAPQWQTLYEVLVQDGVTDPGATAAAKLISSNARPLLLCPWAPVPSLTRHASRSVACAQTASASSTT